MSRRLQRAYLEADPRSLAAGRIALALVLLADLARRAVEIDLWYVNDGLLPNHTVLWRPTFEPTFSFFFMASTALEAWIGFLVCAVAYLALLVGWRTRLAQLASLACVLSLHARTIFLQNGGDVVLSELALWTLFLPTGTRFSLDSLIARMRSRTERSDEDLVPRDRPTTEPIVAKAVLALRLQLAVIYLFNAIAKTGPDWREGSVVHWVLHQDRIVTALGLWVRGWIEPWQSALLTWSSLAIEVALPLLLLSPVAIAGTRLAAVALGIALHAGFGAFLDIGVFPAAMIAYLPSFLPARFWDAVARRSESRRPRRTVFFDASCGFCFAVVRVLARLDSAGRLELVGNDRTERLPRDIDPALTGETVLVVDPETRRRWIGSRAFEQVFRSLPGGVPVAWLLALVRPIAERVYRPIARNRTSVSAALGLAACGIERPSAVAAVVHETPLGRRIRAAFAGAADGVLVLLLVVATSQLLVEHPSIPDALRFRQPRWMSATVSYLQLFQGWSMFAPNAPHGDQLVSVLALDADGRAFDPLNEAGSGRHPAPGERIPPRLGYGALFCEYVARIPARTDYHPALREWLVRNGAASFQARDVTDESPPPGEREPRNTRSRVFLRP